MNFQEFLQPKIYVLSLISLYQLNQKAMPDPMVKTASKNMQPFSRYSHLKIATVTHLRLYHSRLQSWRVIVHPYYLDSTLTWYYIHSPYWYVALWRVHSCIEQQGRVTVYCIGSDKVVRPVNSGLCWVLLGESRGYLKNCWADLAEILQVGGHGQ